MRQASSYDAGTDTLTAPNATITGDLTVQGTTTTVATTNTSINDNTIDSTMVKVVLVCSTLMESGVEIDSGSELNVNCCGMKRLTTSHS